ncbi:MAG: Ig-like domain-containing protein [Gemmatimonadota bacterium]|uniref:Ig-like domain-containing protein n=1 Tax=Candidatus Palauibacter scopulicola TaxID=3056741 RepID=UPI00238E25D6|nr:Ig-like domain-containing protein [Candidatus Palauibacter scopulicola]MDE2664419.1 Ig-like domain-containing protein [Candidatus Palauibacter scopulicola]
MKSRRARVLAVAAVAWAAACGDGEPDVTGPAPVPNRAPEAVGTIPARTLPVGETATVDVSSHFRDPDGDVLSYTAATSNPGVVGVSVSGSSVTVTAAARGVVTITVTGRDPQGLAAQQSFEVTVPNRSPAVADTIPAQTLFTGETATVDASAHFRDPDGDPLSFAATSSDSAVATVTVSGATLTIRAVAAGVATVTVTASDTDGAGAEQRFDVTVPNRAPEAVDALPPLTLEVGETEPVVVSPFFRDPDGDSLTYTAASSNPEVAAVSVSSDSVAVEALAKGLATITVIATDPAGAGAEQRFDVTVPNRAPEVVGTLPPRTIAAGETEPVAVSPYFRDPDGDPLTYTATSDSPDVATVVVTEGVLLIRAVADGTATITVTATDPEEAAVATSFDVTVVRPAHPFEIELVFATPMTAAHEAAFQRAAERWMKILAPTELPETRLDRTLGCGGDPRFERHVETIEGVMIVVAVVEIDGPLGTLGRAGPCWVRTATSLPLYGRILMDAADLNRLGAGDLEELILHEMAHVLGFGTLWPRVGLLRDPASETSSPDTHFTGPLAIAAFDAAGGTDYPGAKVPVENRGGEGSRNSHWRDTVLALELMRPFQRLGVAEPLSAITIQSLADFGYEVDATQAEPYRLPSPDLARALEAAPKIPYGDDIWRGPLIFVDPNGRITRVIPR